MYIQAGSGDAIFGEERHAIRPPAIITVPPGVNHGFRFSHDIDGFVITLLRSHLSHPPGERSQLGEWLAMPHLTALDPDNAEAVYVMQTLRRLGDEFENRRSGRNETLGAYVALVLRLTARISQKGNSDELASNENERRMEMLSELVQQHFRSHKPASFYARELGVSPTHLTRIVRSMTGSTPHELIAGKLVEEAKRQLVFTMGSVQEIGFRLGFADPAYFSRFFLKYMGETPRVWRVKEKARLEQA
ncbi:AraC family transcriptional activator of pobA [Rhizobium leguminosarum]|nr:AraC family transcriptional activator of pobA [Rhizobium leguminosarum]